MTAADGGPAPEAAPATVLQALRDTEPFDAEAAEALRLAHCAICRETRDLPEQWRRGQCDAHRCGLRSARKLHDEGALLLKLGAELSGPAPDVARRSLNLHIWQVAAVTPGLDVTEEGHHTQVAIGVTLRAALHMAMVRYFARRGGDLLINWNEHTGRDAGRIVTAFRALDAQERGDEEDRRVRELADQGLTISAVADKMGWGDDRQRVRESLSRTRSGGASCASGTTSR
jgi:hypothetical protein